jgi:hypothetical protein
MILNENELQTNVVVFISRRKGNMEKGGGERQTKRVW